jgi:hypothetical protein
MRRVTKIFRPNIDIVGFDHPLCHGGTPAIKIRSENPGAYIVAVALRLLQLARDSVQRIQKSDLASSK